MLKLTSFKDLLLQPLSKSQHGILVISNEREILFSNEEFKDTWQLSTNVLRSGNERRGLRESSKFVDNPNRFLNQISCTYAKKIETSHTFIFTTGKVLQSRFYPIHINQQPLFLWFSITHTLPCEISYLQLLTPCEKRVLPYYLLGYTVTTIAAKLGTGERTVETHVQNIKDKFGCRTRDEFIDVANQLNLINVLFSE